MDFAHELPRLHALTTAGNPGALDDQSWRDLLLDRYLDSLSGEVGIFGRQLLYRRLRTGTGADERAARRARVERLLRDRERLDGLHATLRPLREADADVTEMLYDPAWQAPRPPRWLPWTRLLPVALAASIAAAILLGPWAWIAFFAVMVVLIRIQLGHQDRVDTWSRRTHALQTMLRTVSLLDGSGQPLAEDFTGRGARAGSVNRGLARSLVYQAVPDAATYGDWFFQANVKHYYKTLGLVAVERAYLRECWELAANLEADLALARHLRTRADWCWAEEGGVRTLALEEGVHPLLGEASGLSIALDGRGAFVSGQNGVGKSTFLRMLGLNVAAARGFGFAYAKRAVLPALPVVASMQNEDSLLGGQSLYIAELARARELLAAANGTQPVLLLVDEIFRGTNHEESVAAAAAVLDELAERALVVVSSHNLVLGPLLAHRLQTWRIVRGAESGLRLEPGLLAKTNGVALLAQQGFSPAVQAKAARVAAWLARQELEGAGGALVLETGAPPA